MTTTFIRIIFVGLMAIIPNEDEGSMTVLLYDSRDRHVYGDNDGETCVEAHVPALYWDTRSACRGEHCKTSEKDSFRGCTMRHQVKEDGFWLLQHEQISVSGVAPSCSAGCRRDFSKIAMIKRIKSYPKSTRTPSNALMCGPKPGLRVAARLQLTDFSFEECHLVSIDGKVQNVDFGRRPDSYHDGPSPVADVAVATLEVPNFAGEVRLQTTPFGEGAARRSVYLKPADCRVEGDDQKCLTLVVFNQSFPTSQSAIGFHFDRLYFLSKKVRKPKNRRVPRATGNARAAQSRCDFGPAFNELLHDLTDPRVVPPPLPPLPVGGVNNRPICPLGGY